jgi:hypothetical protein
VSRPETTLTLSYPLAGPKVTNEDNLLKHYGNLLMKSYKIKPTIVNMFTNYSIFFMKLVINEIYDSA